MVSAHRDGLMRPPDPPPSYNWTSSSTDTDGSSSSNYVGISLVGMGGLGFGGGSVARRERLIANGLEAASNVGCNDHGSGGHDISFLFENTDEYAPSQGYVQAPSRRVIKLSLDPTSA